ncbi:unnamed protein product [Toxocara canis]|uniref:Uncharacterized protein n=1 Tax=Toxocara canis TaxID=6265 RepID=A0A183U966_TOXCA|nr:unnamed protein product [Toxocara canis]
MWDLPCRGLLRGGVKCGELHLPVPRSLCMTLTRFHSPCLLSARSFLTIIARCTALIAYGVLEV